MATLRHRQRGQALILIFLGTLLIGGAMGGSGLFHTGRQIAELRERASTVVQDSFRRDAVGKTLDALEGEAKAYGSERTAIEKDAFAALERHASTRADLEVILARADALNARARETFLSRREELRARVNAEEWAGLWAPKQEESIEAFKSYGEKQGQ